MSISSLVGRAVDQPEQSDPSETGRTWDMPAVLVAGLSSAQQSALTARLAILRRVLEPDAGDERGILQRYADEATALGCLGGRCSDRRRGCSSWARPV